MLFRLFKLDVWGNETDGYDINNKKEVENNIYFDEEADIEEFDQDVLNWLFNHDFLDSCSMDDYYIDFDEYQSYYICEKETTKPLYLITF